jgi:hypothetical protein
MSEIEDYKRRVKKWNEDTQARLDAADRRKAERNTMEIRNFVLSRKKRAAYYKGLEIEDCGITGTPGVYWITLEDGSTVKLDRNIKVKLG